MKSLFAALPPVLLFALAVALLLTPASAQWADSGFLAWLPYAALAIAFAFGAMAEQSRVMFACVFLAVAVFLVDRSFFAALEPGRGELVLLMSGMIIPVLLAALFRLKERGVMSIHGRIRLIAVLLAAGLVLVLPKLAAPGALSPALSSRPALFVAPASGWLRVPAITLVVFGACIPFFLVRNRLESRRLGHFFMAATLFALAGLNFRSGLWKAGSQRAALMTFWAGGALTLAWAGLESLWRHSTTDELTGLSSRRSFSRCLARLGSEYAIALVDVDHFKRINDRFGHQVGDEALRFVASQIRAKGGGRVYRYGGEEFAIVAENADFADFVSGLDKLRKSIAARPFAVRGAERPARKPRRKGGSPAGSARSISITVSIGAARKCDRLSLPQEVVSAADRALYRAKGEGRNRVKAAR